MTKRAFTFLETLMVLAIILALSGFIFSLINVTANDFLLLRRQTEQIKQVIDSSRERAILGEGGKDWGVVFYDGTPGYFIVVSGPNPSSLQAKEATHLGNNLNFSFSTTSGSTVIFKKHSGQATTTTGVLPFEITLSAPKINQRVRISVPQFGQSTINLLP